MAGEERKDVDGEILNIGDRVAFCGSGKFPLAKKGIIVRFTPQKIVIAHIAMAGLSETARFHWQVIKI